MSTSKKDVTPLTIQTVFILAVILFWGIPFIKDILLSDDASEIMQTCIVLVNPVVCFGLSYWYAQKHSFTWYLPLGLMLLFLPLPFLFYSISDLLYVPLYGLSSMFGLQLCLGVKKYQSKK